MCAMAQCTVLATTFRICNVVLSLSLSLPSLFPFLFMISLIPRLLAPALWLSVSRFLFLSLSLSLCVSLSVSPCLSLFVSAKIEFRLPDTADKIPSMSLVKYAQKDRELQKDMSKPYRTM